MSLIRGDPPDHPAERADQRRLAALGDGHVQVELAADRGHLGADEPGADDQDPPGAGRQRVPQPGRVVARADREHPVQRGFLWVEPGPGAHARGDQQAVVPDLLAIGQEHLPGGPIQPGRRHPEPPLGVDRPHARQRGVVGRHPPVQDLLRQRGAVVRLVRLVPDDGQTSTEALLTQRLGGAEPGE
jgi:hypothetical protein